MVFLLSYEIIIQLKIKHAANIENDTNDEFEDALRFEQEQLRCIMIQCIIISSLLMINVYFWLSKKLSKANFHYIMMVLGLKID